MTNVFFLKYLKTLIFCPSTSALIHFILLKIILSSQLTKHTSHYLTTSRDSFLVILLYFIPFLYSLSSHGIGTMPRTFYCFIISALQYLRAQLFIQCFRDFSKLNQDSFLKTTLVYFFIPLHSQIHSLYDVVALYHKQSTVHLKPQNYRTLKIFYNSNKFYERSFCTICMNNSVDFFK